MNLLVINHQINHNSNLTETATEMRVLLHVVLFCKRSSLKSIKSWVRMVIKKSGLEFY